MTTFLVSSQSELNNALDLVDDGDTIRLESGVYGDLTMATNRWTDHDFAEKVTITSADANNPAKINAITLTSVENVEFSNLVFDYVKGKASSKPFFVQNSGSITFDDVVFDGDYSSSGSATGLGLRVKYSDHVTVSDSTFRNFANGIDFAGNKDIVLVNNDIRGIANDGFTFGGIEGMVISGNDFRDYRSADPWSLHKDHIQFRAGGADAVSKDVVIEDNVFVDDEVRQGVFFGNEAYKGGDTSSYYENITIRDNYLSTGHLHGITVFYGTDIDITGNTVVKNPGMTRNGDVYTPLINVSKYSTDVTIQGNTVASVQDAQDGSWHVSGNVVSGRNYLHWDGSQDVSRHTTVKAGGGGSSGGGATAHTVDGTGLEGWERTVVGALDFGDGDSLTLTGFDAGTFRSAEGGNALAVWADKGAVLVNSVLDLQELSDLSPDVTVQTSGETLTLRVFQDDGVADLVLYDMASDFRASDFPDLF